MQKILMILTSHRLDCFRLCIDLLVRGGSASRFERVAILCSGVVGRHLEYVQSLPRRFPDVRWDFIYGAKGRGKPISDMQNACVSRYPDALYFKLDEDTFVSRDWDLQMEQIHQVYRGHERLALVSAVVTNNQRGAYHLLHVTPGLGDEFKRAFQQPIITDRMGPIWILPQCGAFMMRRFLDLEKGNRELRSANRQAIQQGKWPPGEAVSASPEWLPPLPRGIMAEHPSIPFSYPFSINCICYDYRHWKEIGGVPEEDENGWGKWIPANGKFVVLAADALVHHYSFFVQQNWLDRTDLLEAIRRANIPDSRCAIGGWLARLFRILKQVPGAITRRFGKRR